MFLKFGNRMLNADQILSVEDHGDRLEMDLVCETKEFTGAEAEALRRWFAGHDASGNPRAVDLTGPAPFTISTLANNLVSCTVPPGPFEGITAGRDECSNRGAAELNIPARSPVAPADLTTPIAGPVWAGVVSDELMGSLGAVESEPAPPPPAPRSGVIKNCRIMSVPPPLAAAIFGCADEPCNPTPEAAEPEPATPPPAGSWRDEKPLF